MSIRLWASRMLPLWALLLAILSFQVTGFGQKAGPGATASGEQKQRAKIAQGEYVILERANGGAIGPFGEEVYDFHETWTLWRLPNSGYEVEGERRFESPKGTAHSNRFLAELSRDLTIVRVTEFAHLKWRRDSGPLTCEFLRIALHCSSNARNAQDAIELRIPMQRPFGLLWPISAFSLSGLTREAERTAKQATQIQLVSIEQPSAEMPVNPVILDGEVRYVGEENIDVAGEPRRAFKFSVKAVLSPELLVWTTPRGLLLAVAVQHEGQDWPEERMRLLHFQEWANF